MAYLKIFPIKVTDKKALDYITNPDKTEEKLLVSSFGCSPETADLEFSMTREMAKKNLFFIFTFCLTYFFHVHFLHVKYLIHRGLFF